MTAGRPPTPDLLVVPGVVADHEDRRTNFFRGGREMTDELFGERGRTLEEEFFKRQNAELLAALRAKLETERTRKELANTAGVSDEQVLARLFEAGMTPATLTAMAVVPLVAIAWADGKLEEAERDQVLRYARSLDLGQEATSLLTSWLVAEPEPALFEIWIEYVRNLLPQLDEPARDQLKATTCMRAAAVAEAAAGEPYGVGRQISAEEQSVLRRIEAAFEE
jgi:DNA-binding phage protein